MATSIAKLSIILGIETEKLRKGLADAQLQLKALKNSQKAAADQGVMTARSIGGMVVALNALKQGLTASRRFIADWISAGAKMQTEVARLAGDANALGSFDFQTARFQRYKSIVFEGLADLSAQWIKAGIDAADAIRKMNGLSTLASADESIKGWEKWAKNANKWMDQHRKNAQSLAESTARATEEMKQQADSLTKSLRTPLELMRDQQKELKKLFDKGLLSSEDFNRGLKRSTDEFRSAARAALEWKNQKVGVAEKGTQAALSAVNNAKTEESIQIEIQRQLLKAQLDNNKLLAQAVVQPATKPVSLTPPQTGRLSLALGRLN